jgi:hypothetical protein
MDVTAPLPFAAAYHNVLKMLSLAGSPESTVHLFDAHLKIALATVVDFFVSDGTYATLGAALMASSAYLQQHWEGRFSHNPFKEVLLDTYEFLTQVRLTFTRLVHTYLFYS